MVRLGAFVKGREKEVVCLVKDLDYPLSQRKGSHGPPHIWWPCENWQDKLYLGCLKKSLAPNWSPMSLLVTLHKSPSLLLSTSCGAADSMLLCASLFTQLGSHHHSLQHSWERGVRECTHWPGCQRIYQWQYSTFPPPGVGEGFSGASATPDPSSAETPPWAQDTQNVNQEY